MKTFICSTALLICVPGVPAASAQVSLVAIGSITQTAAGPNADLSGLNYMLENGTPANLLGGMGSGLTYAGGNTFLALPDRGPNAFEFNDLVDNTVSYINRFHTMNLVLTSKPNVLGLPFTVTSKMQATTLLWSASALVYGTGSGLNVGSGVPPVNKVNQYFFTGRSDDFDAAKNSGNPANARFDTESIRVSTDGSSVFISDEYGPYVYQFDRYTGKRVASFTLPSEFYVAKQFPIGATEISGNNAGRTANKGMEGLALTPDGKTLVGIMQAALIHDANQKVNGVRVASKLLRIVTVDIASATVTHEYAYSLTTGSGVSEIVALNNHDFLVDERDGNGREGGSNPNLSSNLAVVKQVFKIDLTGAFDITGLDGATAVTHAVNKSLFLDIVQVLVANGLSPTFDIPSKIEGMTFGKDIRKKGQTVHTLWVANDNDFVLVTADTLPVSNPNQYFVFGFSDADLNGSEFIPQFADQSNDQDK
jgi:hypothetical protein